MPNNLAQLIEQLDAALPTSVKEEIAALPEERLIDLHYGLNALIRRQVFYDNDTLEGTRYFSELGGPDEASGVLGDLYWHHVRRMHISEDIVTKLIERHGILFTKAEQTAKVKELVNAFRCTVGDA